jgi:hypothetical protein
VNDELGLRQADCTMSVPHYFPTNTGAQAKSGVFDILILCPFGQDWRAYCVSFDDFGLDGIYLGVDYTSALFLMRVLLCKNTTF